MDFHEHTLGVKILDNYVAIEVANPFGDLSKYDFIYTDYMSSNWNGNYAYKGNVKVLNNQESFKINGWKLLGFSFPGDWFGNNAYCELEDRNGNTISVGGGNKAVYANSYMHLLRDVLIKAIEFTRKTPSVEVKEILDGLEKKSGKLTLEDLHRLIEAVDNYILKYKRVKETLSAEELETLAIPLKESASSNISKLFGFEIEIE